MARRQLSFWSLTLAFVALPFSIKACHIALIAFLLLWLTEGKWHEKFAIIRGNVVVKLILAFSILQLVGLFYTENTSDGWFAIEKKIFLFILPVALATTFIRFERHEIFRMFYFFTAACIVGSFICLGSSINEFILLQNGVITPDQLNYLSSASADNQRLFTEPWLVFSYVELADGIHIHPTYFSFYLAFCVVALFYRAISAPLLSNREKAVIKVVILYFTIFIVSLSSRIVILSLLVLYVTMLAESIVRKRPTITSVTLAALILILGSTLYTNPVTRYRNLQEVASSSYDVHPNTLYTNSTEIRVSLWWLGLQSLAHVNPILGTGTGDVNDLMQSISKQYDITNVLGTYNPHNEFLYILLGNGIVSLLVFILFLAIPFRKAVLKRDYLLIGFIFLFVSLCLTETILERQKGIVFFAMVFPLLTFQHPRQFTGKKPE